MRIVSLAPSNTEILYALGVEKDVVAVTRFCDYPLEAADKERVGSWIQTNSERLASLRPDLILTSYFLPESLASWTGPGRVVHLSPRTLWDVLESVRVIGSEVGADDAASRVVKTMELGFDQLRATQPRYQPRVYMEEWYEPPMAAGNWVPELVAIAGGEEVIATTHNPSHEFALPALAVADPDLIVCHWCGWGNRHDSSRILNRPGWEGIRAVQTKAVHFLDDSLLNRPGPRLLEGATRLQHVFAAWSQERETRDAQDA